MFFKKKPARGDAPDGPAAEWDLGTVTQQLGQLAPALETAEVEPALVEARLADHYRDVNREPVAPPRFAAFVHGLDAEGWRRLALAVGTLDHADVRPALALGVEAERFVSLAKATDALTLALLRQSTVRVEEFARHLAAHLGAGWRGETAEQSRERLEKLDYKRLLAEAEDAKKQAEDRMAYLRKKQEEELARRRPRGKQ